MGSSYGMTVFLPDDVDRDNVRKLLQDRDIETAVHYPRPVPDLGYYKAKYGEQAFPVARYISAKGLTLPVSPHLWPEQMDRMADKLNEAVNEDRTLRRGRIHRASPGLAPEAERPRAGRARSPKREQYRAVA